MAAYGKTPAAKHVRPEAGAGRSMKIELEPEELEGFAE